VLSLLEVPEGPRGDAIVGDLLGQGPHG